MVIYSSRRRGQSGFQENGGFFWVLKGGEVDPETSHFGVDK